MNRRLTSSELLAMRVDNPQPGQRTIRVKVRLPYQSGFTAIHVDAEQYEAARAPRPTLDLDAMCAAAQQRIADAADNAAYRAKCEHFGESMLIRTRLDQALLRRRTKVTATLTMLDLSPLVKDLARHAATLGLSGGSLGGLASTGLTKAIYDFPRFEPIGTGLRGGRK